jgi:sugar phosphate isomerase/epimerase
MHLSCSTLVFPVDRYPELTDVIRRIKATGFFSVDLAAVHGWQNIDPAVLPSAGREWADKLILVLEETGIAVSSLNAGLSRSITDPSPEAQEVRLVEFRALAELARALSCPNVTIQPGKKPEAGGVAEAVDLCRSRLAALAAVSEELGVGLSFEAHASSLLEDPEEALPVLRDLWPRVGLTFDPSHFVMRDIPTARMEPLLDYTAHVHVRNASSGNMQDTVENGSVDFEWLVQALRRRGYKGALTIEHFGGWDTDLSQTLALKELMTQLGVALC